MPEFHLFAYPLQFVFVSVSVGIIGNYVLRSTSFLLNCAEKEKRKENRLTAVDLDSVRKSLSMRCDVLASSSTTESGSRILSMCGDQPRSRETSGRETVPWSSVWKAAL